MTFQPVLPIGGVVGWQFLNRTLDTQQEAFNKNPVSERLTTYFRENIANIETAEQLVADRQLLQVALGAFGLDDDINNKAFIEKVLADGTIDPEALANRLSDSRYEAFSEAFGFGNFSVPNTRISDFADRMIERYNDRQFQIAVGAQNNNMRLALSLGQEMTEIVDGAESDDAQWFTIMGNPPLRQVFETALGLPSSFGALDIDRQLEVFKERSASSFGTDKPSEMLDAETQETIIRQFLVRSDLGGGGGLSSGSIALTLLANV